MSKIFSTPKEDPRTVLNDVSNKLISDGCFADSLLAEILIGLPPKQKRSIVIGGLMKLANRADYFENAERRSRQHAREAGLVPDFDVEAAD
jgi:hypothetical protein